MNNKLNSSSAAQQSQLMAKLLKQKNTEPQMQQPSNHHSSSQQHTQQPQQKIQPEQQIQPVVQQQPAIPKQIGFECGGTTFSVDERYEFVKQIGVGAYGVVCSANDKKNSTKVAIKKVGKAFEDLVDAKRILREIKLLKFFNHDNIISLVEVQKPPSKTGYDDIYIITELMETDLHRVIYSRQDLTDEHIQYFLYQLLRGLLYIHSANVIHRDLKPSNLLVNKNCDLKICDLGLARGYSQEDDIKTEYVVTRWYRAPEVILQASEYTKAVDIWSVGCIFAELLGRSPLFPGYYCSQNKNCILGKDYLEQIQRIIAILGTPNAEDASYITNDGALKYIKSLPKRTKQQWKNLYPKANPVGLDLLGKILTFNPTKRFTIEQCLEHPYFEGLHSPEEEPVSESLFDWNWDDFELKKETIQSLIYEESLSFQRANTAQSMRR